jgi:hypothetical protein
MRPFCSSARSQKVDRGRSVIHTPCEKREGAEGMLEGDAPDIEGDTSTTLIRLEYRVLKQCRVGAQAIEITVPIDTRNVLEVIDANTSDVSGSRTLIALAE